MGEEKSINCPNCHVILSSLTYYETGTTQHKFTTDEKGPHYVYEYATDVNEQEWVCPECGQVISIHEENACKFLGGKPREQEGSHGVRT